MLSNLAETLHSSTKWKNKQVAKIWGLYLKKQRFGDTMQFPEGLENTPFTTELILNYPCLLLSGPLRTYRTEIPGRVLSYLTTPLTDLHLRFSMGHTLQKFYVLLSLHFVGTISQYIHNQEKVRNSKT